MVRKATKTLTITQIQPLCGNIRDTLVNSVLKKQTSALSSFNCWKMTSSKKQQTVPKIALDCLGVYLCTTKFSCKGTNAIYHLSSLEAASVMYPCLCVYVCVPREKLACECSTFGF